MNVKALFKTLSEETKKVFELSEDTKSWERVEVQNVLNYESTLQMRELNANLIAVHEQLYEYNDRRD